MKKTRRVLVMMVLIVMCLSCLLSFCSCVGRVTYRDPADYATARGDVTYGLEADNSLCEFFPDVEESQIQEMYFYDNHLSWDPCFICYLNCSYSDEEYQTEIARIQRFCEDHPSFNDDEDWEWIQHLRYSQGITYKGFFASQYDQSHKLDNIYTLCFLLKPEENRVVYLAIDADTNKGFWKKSYNLPEEYLPDGFIELRDSQTK